MDRDIQRRHPRFVRDLDVRLCAHEYFDCLRVLIAHSVMQRRVAVPVLGVRIAAGGQEGTNDAGTGVSTPLMSVPFFLHSQMQSGLPGLIRT